jgi:hypothetical protein
MYMYVVKRKSLGLVRSQKLEFGRMFSRAVHAIRVDGILNAHF